MSLHPRTSVSRWPVLVVPAVMFLTGSAWMAADANQDSGAANAARGWVFQPIVQPAIPEVGDKDWVLSPIDNFVLARLETQGMRPAPAVSRRALIRRVTFDLIGLPPAAGEVAAFEADRSPDAYARVVDRLLASPQYGERWGRHWLDVVRYADTDGFAIDGERPTLWRYRDYVVRAFNEDRPFDQFIREQLAGDELGLGDQGLVATGFYRLGPWEADNMVPERKRQDYLNEVTNTIGTAFLGLTVGCARCHDHKYDPIPTADYYRLQAFFAPVRRTQPAAPYGPAELLGDVGVAKARAETERAGRKEAFDQYRGMLLARLAKLNGQSAGKPSDTELNEALGRGALFTKEEKQRYKKLKKAIEDDPAGKRFAAVACTISNPGEKDVLPVTHILKGGDVAAPGRRVSPGWLSAVAPWDEKLEAKAATVAGARTGRRAVLADWVASSRNPLTARVIVNRIWQHHFGVGLVATPNDFGVNGSPPSHPGLLDFLADLLLENQWRLKPVHRAILMSQAYRMASDHPRYAEYQKRDPGNRLLWRAHHRRIEAEAVRDAMLFVSGELDLRQGGPGFFVELPEEMGRKFPFFTWEPSPRRERLRRSIYMFQRRNMVVPLLEAFDAAEMSESCSRRGNSLNTTQVFALWNSRFAYRRARRFADRVRTEAGADRPAQVKKVFQLALGRDPSPSELKAGVSFFQDDGRAHASERAGVKKGPSGEDGDRLSDFCLVVLNSNEFIYLE